MSLAVHVLTWIAFDRRGTRDEIGTSQRIAASVNTNPVVIRRCLGELREAGLVESTRTRGWTLRRAAAGGDVFAMHTAPPDHECVVGQGIQPALLNAYERATAALGQSLAQTSIADILRDTLAAAPKDLQHAH
jgi:DNA-binding IscR family transcriptional regulator